MIINGSTKFIVILLFFFGFGVNAQSQELTVGVEVPLRYESPHPYLGTPDESVTWAQEVISTESEATYVAVHFATINLAPGDRLVIRNPENMQRWEYDQTANNRGAFWSIPIYGNRAVLEIHSSGTTDGGYGYIIDKIARGYTQHEIQEVNGLASICGGDDSKEAKCYESSEPEVYQHARSVARIWLNGTIICTGWLVGSEGHLMTCNHCVSTEADANNTSIEMMAEGATCTTNCLALGACPGEFVANSTTLIQTGCALDYSLLLLPENVSSDYGFLQIRADGPVLGERIYIPQHPGGFGKRIALESDSPSDPSGFPVIQSLARNSCWCGGGSTLISYFADTRGGSSGSPVIGYDDHLVVGLHSCGVCPNGANNISLILADLDYVPNNAVFVDPCNGAPVITHINTNTLYGTDMDMPGDIHIHSGAELLIEAKIGMRQGTRILVERNARLIINNGGVVTKGCDAPDWAGIQVLGNNQKIQPEHNAPLTDPDQAGIVWIDNGTVEWARTGVTAGGGYGAEFWGGVIWTNNNATFRNNRKDVEFMQYKFALNKSRFKNTRFLAGLPTVPYSNREGITIWETDGIEFDNCDIYSKGMQAIRTYDAGIKVHNGCHIQSNNIGISSYATYPMSYKSIIGTAAAENNFSGNAYDIYASTATGLYGLYNPGGKFSMDVVNNNFEGSLYGIILDGPSNFRIGGNRFTDVVKNTWTAQTGYNNVINQNLIGCNQFGARRDLGILAIGDNKQMQFLGNDFVGGYAPARDFLLTNSWSYFANGAIQEIQGNPFVPAGNCFSDPGVQIDIQTWATTDYFTYYYESGEPPVDCDPEPLNPGNYGKVGVPPSIFIIDCDQFGGLPEGLESPTEGDLNTKRQQMQTLDPSIQTDANAKVQYYQILAEKEAILKYLVSEALDEKDFVTAESLLAGEQSKAAQWAIFGLRMGRQDYTGAAQLLNQLPIEDATDTQFRDIQLINLQRLQNPTGFELSALQETYLNSVADSYSPIRGYARGILSLLKDRVYYPDEYDISEERSSLTERVSMDALKIYPVPASDQLVVAWPTLPENANAQIQVFDLLGRQHISLSVGAKETNRVLDVANLPEGVYFLVISDKGKVAHRTKFTVQH